MDKIIIIVSLFISINIYSDFKFSLKGGINYSNSEYLEKDKGKEIRSEKLKYKYGKMLFLSFNNDIYKDIYGGIEFGFNEKNISPSLEVNLTIGYEILSTINLFSGVSTSFIFADSNKFGYEKPYLKNYIEYGLLIGSRFEYKNFLIEFKYQIGFSKINPDLKDYPLYDTYINSKQFLFIIGYIFPNNIFSRSKSFKHLKIKNGAKKRPVF